MGYHAGLTLQLQYSSTFFTKCSVVVVGKLARLSNGLPRLLCQEKLHFLKRKERKTNVTKQTDKGLED